MVNILTIVAVILGLAVGAFSPNWILLVTTVIFGGVLAVAYVVSVAGKSLFEESERVPITPQKDLSFNIFIITFSFFVSMWLAFLLK